VHGGLHPELYDAFMKKLVHPQNGLVYEAMKVGKKGEKKRKEKKKKKKEEKEKNVTSFLFLRRCLSRLLSDLARKKTTRPM
jgi:hypothetical protein